MKNWLNAILLFTIGVIFVVACKKDEIKVIYKPGTAPVLTSSVSTLVLDKADSLNEAVRLSWTSPDYGYENAEFTLDVTYKIEIDSAGKDFSKAQSVTVVNELEKKFTAAELNLMLIKLGFKAGTAYDIDIRVTSSFYSSVSKYVSNIVRMNVTPYSVKPTPKYAPPAGLFIVGDATPGGWGNPVPAPSQALTPIDENTFGIVIQLTGGKHYLLLPVNGSWDHKYAVADNSDPNAQSGGPFIVDAGQDIPAPAADGLYKIIVNFLTGEYTVTPATAADAAPDNLFVVGDATPGGWNNPVPVPNQQFTKTSNSGFELTVTLTGGKHYLLLPVNGSWDHKFAVADNSIPADKDGGSLTTDSGQDIPAPDVDGTYKIQAEFITKTYKVTKL